MKRQGSPRQRLGLAAGVIAVIILYAIFGGEAAKKPYVLDFGGDFQPGLASRDDLGISVVVAVDCSGSMADSPATGGAAKYRQASAALSEVAAVLGRISREAPPGQILKVGLLRFSDATQEIMPLALMDGEGLARFSTLVADPGNFQPGGGTAIGAAIETGSRLLAQSGTVLRSLILVTDGENTVGVEPEEVLAALRANRNSASSKELPVYTDSTLVSFIGFDIDSGRFAKLASLGSRVSSASDRAGLASAISDILEADITRLESPGLGQGGGK